ncbi:hypothetical protein SAMN05444287_1349 [Octadecabacter temperatus]|uniref:Uncharacterized protein n=1 Tax=Octadecabacter temperatus TaxID=1458307 RepID=A0A0K0Y5P3_9RHOB|nr:glyceraldehyde-3-phosphate dehydrogenase [Octadecabacter temperatus]AKS46240.1 hypothetical protein OSB_16920 [Octadecabacter temperatus]SIO10334.1 hypothetical protein SAMN05444287_1349 [Octadecabacter temperatus]
MTTRLAFILFLLIAAFFVLDHYVLHLNAGVFLGRKIIELMSWIAIWR